MKALFWHILRGLVAVLLLTLAVAAFALPWVHSELVDTTHGKAHTRSYMLPEFVSVIDGDTVKVIIPALKPYPPLAEVNIRIYGIDTPESTWRAKCDKERNLAQLAKNHTIGLIGDSKRIKITDYKYGKYGKRILAKITVKSIDIGKSLIDNGFAKPYFGKGPKHDWCK